mmetsp:Transcript_22608/g.41463  ORF Transcript_22608/g.41463 Transcript_22608/m.41463 type:complete len:106 (+) Transcript_22608:785-1102(+)
MCRSTQAGMDRSSRAKSIMPDSCPRDDQCPHPFYSMALSPSSTNPSRRSYPLANSRRQNSQCHRNSHHARIHSMPPSLNIQHHQTMSPPEMTNAMVEAMLRFHKK